MTDELELVTKERDFFIAKSSRLEKELIKYRSSPIDSDEENEYEIIATSRAQSAEKSKKSSKGKIKGKKRGSKASVGESRGTVVEFSLDDTENAENVEKTASAPLSRTASGEEATPSPEQKRRRGKKKSGAQKTTPKSSSRRRSSSKGSKKTSPLVGDLESGYTDGDSGLSSSAAALSLGQQAPHETSNDVSIETYESRSTDADKTPDKRRARSLKTSPESHDQVSGKSLTNRAPPSGQRVNEQLPEFDLNVSTSDEPSVDTTASMTSATHAGKRQTRQADRARKDATGTAAADADAFNAQTTPGSAGSQRAYSAGRGSSVQTQQGTASVQQQGSSCGTYHLSPSAAEHPPSPGMQITSLSGKLSVSPSSAQRTAPSSIHSVTSSGTPNMLSGARHISPTRAQHISPTGTRVSPQHETKATSPETRSPFGRSIVDSEAEDEVNLFTHMPWLFRSWWLLMTQCCVQFRTAIIYTCLSYPLTG